MDFESMRVFESLQRRCPTQAIRVIAVLAVSLLCAAAANAGIVLPEQVTFDVNDLEQSLQARSSMGSSSSAPANRVPLPFNNGSDEDPKSPLSTLESHLPSGGASSTGSTSSSSVGGPSGGACVCPLATALTLRDDSPLGRLAEDHALTLPDPPGTDLLRPPQHV